MSERTVRERAEAALRDRRQYEPSAPPQSQRVKGVGLAILDLADAVREHGRAVLEAERLRARWAPRGGRR